MIDHPFVRVMLYLLGTLIVMIFVLKGPLHSYVPSCPVTFGFCMERGPT